MDQQSTPTRVSLHRGAVVWDTFEQAHKARDRCADTANGHQLRQPRQGARQTFLTRTYKLWAGVCYVDLPNRRLAPADIFCHRCTTSGCTQTAKSAVRAIANHAKPSLARTLVETQAVRPTIDQNESVCCFVKSLEHD